MEAGLSEASGHRSTRLAWVVSCWLVGDLEAEARLGFGSADRPDGRGAAAVTPALGLRWWPDVGRWRPLLGLEAGQRLPLAGLEARPTAAARAGVGFFVRRQLSLSLAAGWRWTGSAAGGIEAVVGLGYTP
jgi:hypothetical protein